MGAAGALSGGATRRQAVLVAGAAVGHVAMGSTLLGGCTLPVAEDPALASAVEALVRPLEEARQFSGAVVLMHDGQVLLARGWGVANHALELVFTSATPCDAASLAKNFTAAGIVLLVHEGRLQLQQPVQALVPEYPHRAVSVDHLLTHSNGLAPDYGSFDRHFQPGQVRTTPALLALAGRDAPAPAFEPGSRFAYSDLAYDTLALVIERVSGQPFAEFVQQRFFGPHGLRHAFARPPRLADWPLPRARGYRFEAGRWRDDDAFDGEAFVGGSNLILSAHDLARWGDAWAQARVLPAAAERMAGEVPVLGGQPSAINRLAWYGPHKSGAAALEGHNTGDYNGFRACVHWDRERRDVVAYVSNSALPQAQGARLQRELRELLAARRPATT